MEQHDATLADSRIDEEDIRLTTGFADIFTAILLVVGGVLLASLAGSLPVPATGVPEFTPATLI